MGSNRVSERRAAPRDVTVALMLAVLLTVQAREGAALTAPLHQPVVAVVGLPALLPCPSVPTRREDTHQLVLVFKDGDTAPVYSWDSRPRLSPDTSCRRCPAKSLEHRAYFWDLQELQTNNQTAGASDELMGDKKASLHIGNYWDHFQNTALANSKRMNSATSPPFDGEKSSAPSGVSVRSSSDAEKTSTLEYSRGWRPSSPGLALSPVALEDAGDYLCRVDFKSSPTRNTFIRLQVLEPITSVDIRGFVTSRPLSSSSDISHTPPRLPLDLSENPQTRWGKIPGNSLPRSLKTTTTTTGWDPRVGYPGNWTDDFRRSSSNRNRLNEVVTWASPIGGRSVPSGTYRTIGPFPAGEELLLQCEVIHGKPPPILTWLEGGVPLPPSSVSAGEQRSSLSYRVTQLGGADVGRRITCVAENDKATPLVVDRVLLEVAVPTTTVRIFLDAKEGEHTESGDLPPSTAHEEEDSPLTNGDISSFVKETHHPLQHSSLKAPEDVHLLDYETRDSESVSPNHFLQTEATANTEQSTREDSFPGALQVLEGTTATLVCVSSGSRPPASLVWSRDGELFPEHLIYETRRIVDPPWLTKTKSTLRLLATPSLDGAMVRCRATVAPSVLPEQQASINANVTLRVLYSPVVTITATGAVPLDQLHENSSVALHCRVEANPALSGPVTFYRNDQPLQQVASAGQRQLNASISLQLTGPSSAGRYSCSAQNSRGTTTSPPLHLRVNYAPRCALPPHSSYSSRGGETLSISCTVHAQPRPTVFRWYQVPSNGSVPVLLPSMSHSDRGRSSSLLFQSPPGPPYPVLRCEADNAVGPTREPCLISILPAAEPDPVQSCRVRDSRPFTDGAATISCLPGKDGGLNQSFTLEVRPTTNPQARPPKALYLSSSPEFVVKGLFPSEEYTLTVTATNARGLSPPYALTYTTPVTEQEVSRLTALTLPGDLAPLLLVTFMAMTAVVLCSVMALLARWFYRRYGEQGRKYNHRNESGLAAHTGAEYTRLQRCNHPTVIDGNEEKSPFMRLCGMRGGGACVGGACAGGGGADGSSFGGDSLSRGSCQSTTDTLLWTLASDSYSHQTFRNSGCYHIANLNPPDYVISEHSLRPSCVDDRESLEGFNTELQILGTLSSNGSHSPSYQHSPQMVFNHSEVDGCSTPGAIVHPAIKLSPAELFPRGYLSATYTDPTEGTLTSLDHQDCPNTNPFVSPISNLTLDTASNCRSCQSSSLSVGRPSSSLSSSRPSSSISVATVALNPDYRPISVADEDDP